MADNTINVKIREAYDTEANWTQKNPKLLQGQIAISSDKHGMYKVGDGTKTWSQLSYASHPASDVYAWAKAQTKPGYSASEITGSVTGVKGSSETSYRTGDVNITKAHIGLGNVENKSSATIRGEITQSNVTAALGFTPAKNSDLALKQDIRIDGSAYNPNAAGYVGSSGAKKYARILIPNQQNIWSMIWMELSVRYNYNAQNGAYHGKVFVSLHHNNVSPYTWQNLHAVAIGHHDPNMAVYASDGKYVYVLMNTAYQTISVDKILVGDSARSVDLSNITVDFVDELPSTHQTAVMLFSENPPKVNGFTVQQNVPENAKFTDTTYTFGTGDANGQIKVTPSGGTAQNISVKGLGSLAYLSSLDASDVGAATSDHTHSVATSGANGFMSSSDKSRLDSLSEIITIPQVDYNTLPSKSTNSNVYFKEWLAYIVANYNSKVRSGKVIIASVRPNSQGTVIGWCYTANEVDSQTGLPRYCCFIYIPLGNNSPIKFGCNNYEYYYSNINTTYTAANAAPGKIATSSSTGTSSNYARQDHTHGIDLATGDANGQVKIAGTNVSVKGLAALAYKNSLEKADVGLGNVDNKSSATIRGEITSSNVTTALGYVPVNKTGDTMSSSLNITKDGETGVEVNNTAQSHKVGFIVGSSGNAGIYDRTKSKWVVYSTTAGDVVLNGNAKSATTSSFLNPTDSNTTYGSSTERGTITDGVVVFGESFRNTVDFVNEDESMINDSGDITMWMKQEADDDVRLNMSIDGDYYAHKDQVIAKLSEVVTLNGDQTVLGYKTFPGALMTGTLTITPPESNYGHGIIITPQSGTSEGGQITLGAPPDDETLPGVNIDQYMGKFRIFGNPSADEQTAVGTGTPLVIDPYGKTITGDYTLTGHATNDVPISTGFGQNLSGYVSSDDNNISGTVVRYSNGQATGKPTGTDHALFQMAYSDIWKTQLAQDWRTNKAYIRSCNNGTWGDWSELYKIGDALNTDISFANSGTGTRQIWGIAGDNDRWRVAGGATAANAGWMEIAVADDGNEPIYARQYTGAFATVKRTATILDANGNTSFPNRLYVGTEQDTQEQQIVCRSSAGTLYLYSQNGQGNNRGLYCPAHGSGSAIGVLSIDTNNQPTYSGYLNRETYQPTTAASWGIPFCSRYNRNELSINNSLWYHFRAGTTSAAGYAVIQVGNNIAETTANGTRGRIRIFGNNTGYSDLYTNVTTSSKAIYLPARGGTIFTTEMFSLSGTTLTISTS